MTLIALSCLGISQAEEVTTALTGGDAAHENMQPFTTLFWGIATAEVVDGEEGGFSETGSSFSILGEIAAFPIGELSQVIGPDRFTITEPFLPPGWMPADGRLLDIDDHPKLFSVLGTVYGGDGTSNFALPDLRGRTPIGVGQGLGIDEIVLGQVLGEETVQLNETQLPAHVHTTADQGDTPIVGDDQAHNNYMPSLGLQCLISTNGTFPSPSRAPQLPVTKVSGDNRFYGEMRWYAGIRDDIIGTLPCDGRLLQIAQNPALFSILGSSYGGDGETTFAIPDVAGRVMIHPSGSAFRFATVGGSSSKVLSSEEMASHSHTITSTDEESGVSGNDETHNNLQPYAVINHLLSLDGAFPSTDSSTVVDEFILGDILLFAGNFAPREFSPLNGQLLTTASFSSLFALIGVTYGGDPSIPVNFGVPDLSARVVLGYGQGDGLSMREMGDQGGAENVAITVAELPSHQHGVPPVDSPLCWALRSANGSVATPCL